MTDECCVLPGGLSYSGRDYLKLRITATIQTLFNLLTHFA
jgi:hypothetical protein